MSDDQKESAGDLLAPKPSTVPVDRASESIVASRDYDAGKAGPTAPRFGRISSGAIEIPRESLSLPPPEIPSIVPPPAVVSNALERNRSVMPLSTIVGVAAGIIVVLVGLALLLFR